MPAPEYIMALDVGNKRIGVALAHRIARLPRPLTTLQHTADIISQIQQLVTAEQVGAVVVGLPRGMDGGYTEQTRLAEAFKQKLEGQLAVPVFMADETLTSVKAEDYLAGTNHTKADIDAVAACYILEEFLVANAKVLQ